MNKNFKLVKFNNSEYTLRKNEALIISSSMNKDVLVFYIKGKRLRIVDESFTPEGVAFIRTIGKTSTPCNYTRLEIKNPLVLIVEYSKTQSENYKLVPTKKGIGYKKIEINIDPNTYTLDDNNELIIK